MTDTGKCPAFGYDCEYVAKVEAQAAEIEAMKTLLVATGQVAASHFKTAKERAAEIAELKSWKAAEDAHHHKLRAEIERLREALLTICQKTTDKWAHDYAAERLEQ